MMQFLRPRAHSRGIGQSTGSRGERCQIAGYDYYLGCISNYDKIQVLTVEAGDRQCKSAGDPPSPAMTENWCPHELLTSVDGFLS